MVIAKQDITLFFIKDISSVTRYYTLQSSEPSVPTTNPPSSEWSDSEPSYTSGSNDTLYFVDLTVFTDETWTYSNVSKSSSYEAAKDAFDKIDINNNIISDRLLSIETNTESINLYVSNLESNFDATTDKLQDDIYSLQEKVDMQITEDAVDIQIDKKLQNGVDKVVTSTGFRFNEDGLKINKSGNPIETQITENGMSVNKIEKYSIPIVDIDVRVSSTDGFMESADGFVCSSYIKIKSSTITFINDMASDNQYNAFYDEVYDCISTFSNKSGTVEVPSDASFFRVSMYANANLEALCPVDSMLTATAEGVNATNLEASTYLIINGRSRFQNYENGESNRTACFWIGE